MNGMKTGDAPRAAEFFAGVGLVRMAMEQAGFRVVFANDIDRTKRDIYSLNFDPSVYLLDDIRKVHGDQVPDIELATASFPCTDLSLAGNRAGLLGSESSLLGEFLRVLAEMGERRPGVVLIENVTGFASSKDGQDLRDTIQTLNTLGYTCDVIVLDARRFVPQSRPRLFLIAFHEEDAPTEEIWLSSLRPAWFLRFAHTHPMLRMLPLVLPLPPEDSGQTLTDMLEWIPPADERWWGGERRTAFLVCPQRTSSIGRRRLSAMLRETPNIRKRSPTLAGTSKSSGSANCVRQPQRS